MHLNLTYSQSEHSWIPMSYSAFRLRYSHLSSKRDRSADVLANLVILILKSCCKKGRNVTFRKNFENTMHWSGIAGAGLRSYKDVIILY